MQHMKFFLAIFCLLASATLFGQTLQKVVTDTTGKNVDSSSVIVHKDARLDLLVKKQAEINEATTRESRRTDKGFRILIISTNSREEAIAAKTKVYSNFPELKAYLWHQSPYYKVKAGNFKDRKDAETYQRKLNPFFPKGVFIMKDVIEVKPGKENETED